MSKRVLGVALATLCLAAACSSTVSSSSSPPAPIASGAEISPSQSAGQPTSPTPTDSTSPITGIYNIAYEATGSTSRGSERLDVYAPSAGGPYPVVVVFHGSPPTNNKSTLSTQARALAGLGAVVFVPSWGHFIGAGYPDYAQSNSAAAQVACAVAFARANGPRYDGDSSRLILVGHSGGATVAELLAFNRPSPSSDCPSGTQLGTISALSTWDADWLSMDPGWDQLIVQDPRLIESGTPWLHMAEHRDLRVALLTDEIVGPYVRDLSDPAKADAFFAPRDPSGTLRPLIEQLGLIQDGQFDIVEMQRFAAEYLKRQGNPVTLSVMPGATHDAMGANGLPVFLDALKPLLSDS